MLRHLYISADILVSDLPSLSDKLSGNEFDVRFLAKRVQSSSKARGGCTEIHCGGTCRLKEGQNLSNMSLQSV
jgi:hypothetical protein